MSITIKELVEVCAATGEVSKVLAEKQVEAIFAAISDSIKGNEEVIVRNFGRFSTKTRAARTGRNPKTGEAIQIEAKTVIKFTPRGDLK